MNKAFLTRPAITAAFKQRFAYSTATDSGKYSYLVIAKDFTDPGCLERRMAVRNQHLVEITEINKQGLVYVGGATLDSHESGKMTGSAIIAWSDSVEQLKDRIENDPYYKGKVWEKYEIYPYRIAIHGETKK